MVYLLLRSLPKEQSQHTIIVQFLVPGSASLNNKCNRSFPTRRVKVVNPNCGQFQFIPFLLLQNRLPNNQFLLQMKSNKFNHNYSLSCGPLGTEISPSPPANATIFDYSFDDATRSQHLIVFSQYSPYSIAFASQHR